MSKARPIHPGATYVITRHAERGYCLLRPDRKMTQFILYALIVSAVRYGVQVHAFCAMPAYLQYVVTDTDGQLPRFLEMFHKLVGRGVKCIRQWEGALWNRKQTSVVELVSRTAIVEEIAHTLASPVAAGLVRSAREWPGAKTLVDNIGHNEIAVPRPSIHFGSKSTSWATIARIHVTIPPSLADIPAETVRDDINTSLKSLEASALKHYGAQGFLGVAHVMKIQPEGRTMVEASRSRLPPQFVAARKTSRSRIDAARSLRNFRARYEQAFDAWRSGDRTVEFPAGTWAMRVLHGARIAVRTLTPQT